MLWYGSVCCAWNTASWLSGSQALHVTTCSIAQLLRLAGAAVCRCRQVSFPRAGAATRRCRSLLKSQTLSFPGHCKVTEALLLASGQNAGAACAL